MKNKTKMSNSIVHQLFQKSLLFKYLLIDYMDFQIIFIFFL